MALKKITDDTDVRAMLTAAIDRRLEKAGYGGTPDLAADIAGLFDAVATEQTQSKVAGQEVTLERVIAAGGWDVKH